MLERSVIAKEGTASTEGRKQSQMQVYILIAE